MEDPTTREPHPTPGPRHSLSSFQSRQIALTRETLSKGNSFHLILHLSPAGADEQGFVSSACVCAPIYTLLRVATPLLWRMFNWSFSVAYPKQSSQGGKEVEKKEDCTLPYLCQDKQAPFQEERVSLLILAWIPFGAFAFYKENEINIQLCSFPVDKVTKSESQYGAVMLVLGDTGWYWVVLGQYRAVRVNIWCYWVEMKRNWLIRDNTGSVEGGTG